MAPGGASSESRRRSHGPRKLVVWVLAVSVCLLLAMSISLGRAGNNSFTSQIHYPSAKQGTDPKGKLGGGNSTAAELEDGFDLARVPAFELEFAYQERKRLQCLRSVQEKIFETYAPYFEKYTGKVVLMDVALHSNLGDNILWRAAIKLLAAFNVSPAIVCYYAQPSWTKYIDKTFPKCNVNEVIEVVKDNGLILLHAGGNWGDLYRHVQEPRLKLIKQLNQGALKHGFGIIQLPQSVYYSPNSKKLEEDNAIMKEVDPRAFTLFVRSYPSYVTAKKLYPHISVKLTPDIALVLGPLLPPEKPKYDVMIHFRQDREAEEADKNVWGWVEKRFRESNVTYRFQDWWYKAADHDRELSSQAVAAFSEVRLEAAMRIINQGKIVVTNRLHGSIVSTLMGKTVFYVDTKERKLQNVRTTGFSSSLCSGANLHAVRKESLQDAIEEAIALIENSGDALQYN